VATGSPDWLTVLRTDLICVAEEAAHAARLATVDEHLDNWVKGSAEDGLIAADALDQLEGVCGDLIAALERLRGVLPVVLEGLPHPPE